MFAGLASIQRRVATPNGYYPSPDPVENCQNSGTLRINRVISAIDQK